MMHELADVMTQLLGAGADVAKADSEGLTPLSQAAARGEGRVVKLLLEAGANVRQRDSKERTPMWWAIHSKCKEAEQLLREAENALQEEESPNAPLLLVNGMAPLSMED